MTMDDTRGAPNHSLGFLFTVVAGLATVLGTAFIPALKWGSQDQVAGGALGFAAGVMLYVSFVDVLGEEAKEFFENHFSLTGKASGHHVQKDKGEGLRVRIWTAFFLLCWACHCSAVGCCYVLLHSDGVTEAKGPELPRFPRSGADWQRASLAGAASRADDTSFIRYVNQQ
mmetsp:Transcript_25473/g.41664  ORF Transcript_25473/g.41664 Transcript_25473/m.41664 type:complete len:171 (+) Transcript_25473:58-570(+)